MDDNELIDKCKNGEKHAFQQLISKYHPYVNKYLGNISDDESIAEDLTQETFIKLIRNIEKFDQMGKAKFSTYLIQIAKNCYIDYYRSEKKRLSNIPLDFAGHLESDTPSVETAVINTIYKDGILSAMNDLTIEQQIVIKMKYFEDLTLKEIGELLNLEPKTVKSRIHNGMMKLRNILARKDYNETD